MGKHQKRISAPKSWSLARKEHYWVSKTSPGPHSYERSIPLILLIRDILNFVDNRREARIILNEGKILLNGRARKNEKHPVGAFDILSIPLTDTHYRVLPDSKGRMMLTKINGEDAKDRLCKISNISIVKNGKRQLNFHDGSNILVTDDIDYKATDSIILNLSDNQILGRYKFQEGSYIMVIGGKHSGEIGSIEKIRIVSSSLPNVISFKNAEGNLIETIQDYIFVVGEEKVEINFEGIE